MTRGSAWIAAAAAGLIVGCASLPPLDGRSATVAVADTDATRLGRAIAPRVAANRDKTGIHPLHAPRDAFAARILLAAAAERSLDVQYYIWRGDQTGHLLFESLWRAAQRGVRVRLLLDDANTAGLDEAIAALDAHPNVEVRLYNPVANRGARVLDFVTDFARVNRRMHNKSFTADNQATIVGGRNVGNEYFGAGDEVVFADLDVLAIGAVVRDVSREFDAYWNSPSAYPAASLLPPTGPDAGTKLAARFAATRADPAALVYLDAVREAQFIRELLDGGLALEWTAARLEYDDPAKTLDLTGRTDVLLFPDLVRTMGRPTTSLDLVSPYFVPGAEGTAALAALAESGVKVRVLTNSLAASDVGAVHAGYAKRRADLLRAGVRIYEFKPSAAPTLRDDPSMFRSQSAALHAKTFAVDGDRIFVGSFNFDPRSARLNTEMGLVIASPTLAHSLSLVFDADVPRAAYEVRLGTDGRSLEWIERTPTGERRFDVEPGTSVLRRLGVEVLSIFPIEWLL
jgi:phosphatidylserine/phosphatidylglycerophosphate/cardiolipin synthase-like enzyme